jgi:HEAT repeat protein
MGLAQSARQVTMALQVPGALLAEFARRRKLPWALMTFPHRLLWFVPAFALLFRQSPSFVIAATLAVITLGSAMDSLTAASWHSWMADLVPEHSRGQFWSTRQGFTVVAMLLMTLVSGVVLDYCGTGNEGAQLLAFGGLLAVAAAFGTADIAVHLLVPEPVPLPRVVGQSIATRILRPLQDRNFRSLTLAISVWAFACNITVLNQVYLKQVFHVTYSELALTNICASIAAVGAGFLLGRVIDRVGARPFTIVMMTVAPMFGIFWFVLTAGSVTVSLPWLGERSVRQAILIMATQSLISGGLYSAVGLGHLTLLGSLAPREGRTIAMAVHWTIVGLLGAAGPLCAGVVADFFAAHPSSWTLFGGTHFHFVHVVAIAHMLLVWLVALPILKRIRTPTEPSTVSDAFANIIMVNPIRFAFGLFYLRQLGAASSPRHRLRSVSRLGRGRARLAVADLVKQLDDPDADVREAAVGSLGRIGSPAAIDALLRKLDDPQTDLAAHILRTLRRSPDRRSVDALLRFLGESDRELVRESARALGATGDPRAVMPLLSLLRRTTDDTVAEASSDALAHLGDIAAIFEILPRLRRTTNPVLRRSLAVAVGNLLGKRDEFYRLLASEEQDAGSAFEDLFRSLRSRVRKLAADGSTDRRQSLLIARIRKLESLVESADYASAANEALRLARSLAALAGERRQKNSNEVFIDVLVWQDQRYAVGYWFLSLLACEDGNTPGATEIPDRLQTLLAIYVLDGWAHRMGEPAPEPDAMDETP